MNLNIIFGIINMADYEFKSLFTEEQWNNLKQDKKEYFKLYRRYKKHGDINYRKSFDYTSKVEGWSEMSEKERRKYYDLIKVKTLYENQVKDNELFN